MKAHFGKHDDGMIGLGVLVLMTMALIASQVQGGGSSSTSLAMAPAIEATILDSRNSATSPAAKGAIREFRIVPTFMLDAPDLDWSSDEELVDSYRKTGF